MSEQKLQEGAGEIGTLRHIAFIMDGNGRWAQRRGQPREFGHRAGVKSLKRVAKRCTDRGIESITVYAFSTENWKRPKKEVDAILDLLSRYLDDCIRNHRENKVHVRILGDVSVFSESFREKMKTAEEITRIYPTCLNIALNYGGRAEIVHAYQKLRSEGKETVTEEEFERALYTADLPSLDMIVRTGAICVSPTSCFGRRHMQNCILRMCCGRIWMRTRWTRRLIPFTPERDAMAGYDPGNAFFFGIQ